MASNARDMSSSPGLSTPPKSPSSPSSGELEAIVVQPKSILYPGLNKSPTQKSGIIKSTKAQSAGAAGGEQSAPKQPRKRAPKTDKKKEDGDAPPKQRKPRAKKQKDDPTAASTMASKSSVIGQSSAAKKMQPTVQPLINEVLFTAPQVPPKHPAGKDASASLSTFPIGNKKEAIQKSIKPEPLAHTYVSQHPQIQMQTHSISTSRGQNYDPIRSSTIEIPRPIQISNPATPAQTSPVKTAGRASASPSIASLINPPTTQNVTTASRPSSSSASHSLHISPHQNAFVQQPQNSAASIASPRSVPPIPTPTVKPPTPPPAQASAPPTAMDIDSDAPAKPLKSNSSRKPSTSTNNSSTVPSPKQPGTKSRNSGGTPTLPPLPGTGLLSGSSLFNNNGGNTPNDPSTSNQTIIIDVPLNGEGNKYINFARLVEEKYGRDALFPKQKAQRDRMARIAAAGAALENARKANGTSADEMSLDVSDNEGEHSNADKKGSEPDEGAPKKRKRTMKEDQYDKDDPFVDDTELAWEEQAAAVKDGFFVYSGPLIKPGDRPDIERANGTKPASTRGRGRGRGGGPGSRGGRGSRGGGVGRGRGAAAAAAASTSAAVADTPDGNSETGPEVKRPRGGGAVRKPRITKADRARMEQEKLDRERAAQGLTSNGNPPPLAAASSISPGLQVVLPKSPAHNAGAAPGSAAPLEMVASR